MLLAILLGLADVDPIHLRPVFITRQGYTDAAGGCFDGFPLHTSNWR